MTIEHERLADLLIGALSARSMTALELSDSLRGVRIRASRTDVNSVLYARTDLFQKSPDNPPRWTVVGQIGGDDAPSIAAPTGAKAQQADATLELYAWQQEALEAWAAAGHRGVVEAVTGTGKTRVGLAAALDAIAAGGKVQVLVPSLELLRQWTEQLREWAPTAQVAQMGDGKTAGWYGTDVILSTVQSAYTRDLGSPGPRSLLIADECHRYGSEMYSLALDERFDRRLGLSATYLRSDDGNTDYLDPYFGDTCFRMGYERAIADGVTARFKVALVGVTLDPMDALRYEEANRGAYKAQQWLIEHGFVPSEPFGEFMKAVAALAEGGAGKATIKARQFLSHFKERRRILAETPAKADRLAHLMDALRNADRSILFTQTIASAEGAAEIVRGGGLDCRAIHSELSTDDRKRVMKQFSAGDLRVIAAPQVLDEGVDVPAADLAVIIAASRTRRQMIQRMGRVLRRKADERRARFVLLYAENTSEDPERGAHAEYLDEIIPVADDVKTFHSGDSAQAICAFLNAGLSGTLVPSVPPPAVSAQPAPRATTEPPLARPRPSMDPERKAQFLGLYAEKHPTYMARFGAEVDRLLDALQGMRDDSLRHAIRRSHDPREMEHQARVYEARFKPPARPEPSRDAPSASRAQGPKPTPTGNKPAINLVGNIPERPRYTGVGPDARYCGACGLLEVMCKC